MEEGQEVGQEGGRGQRNGVNEVRLSGRNVLYDGGGVPDVGLRDWVL